MKKKALSFALALVVCLGLLPANVLAASSDFVIENGVLTKYKGSGKNITIPSSVTEIGMYAFSYCNSLNSVTIPNSVTKIGICAFLACDNLTSVSIPDSVTEIDPQAFYICRSLTSITIPNGVTKVAFSSFGYCESLTSVTIPTSVTCIEYQAFEYCTSLTSIAIPDSVTEIGESAFWHCANLTNITIPKQCKKIDGAFNCCSGLTSITIPNTVTELSGQGTFYGCSNLASITIPASVTKIDKTTFVGCTSLKDVYYGGTREQWATIEWDAFYFLAYHADGVDGMETATIHYNSGTPQPEKSLAKAGNQDIEIDGSKVAFQTYMLADANGNGTNYVKLRDIAHVLNGTGAQFSVGYNRQEQSISAATGAAYKDTGTEMDTPFAGADKEYVQSQLTIVVDGAPIQLDAITLADDAGGAYNYFQLRELGKALGFNVGYSRARGVYIETDKPYAG